MVKSKFTPEQKIRIVLESIRTGTSTAELCRKHNVHPQTFHNWKQRFMESGNNESERMLRKVVIHRKIRQKLVTVGGKIMFGTIMTCLLTWDKMGLNWFEKLSEVFWAT